MTHEIVEKDIALLAQNIVDKARHKTMMVALAESCTGGMIAAAMFVALLSSFCGLLLSYHYNLPSGPAIILVIGVFYILSLMLGSVGGLVSRSLVRPHIET